MDEVLIICRFLHFCAAMLLFGSSAFNGLVVPARLRDDPQPVQRRIDVALALSTVITMVVWLCLEAGEAGDGWEDIVNPDVLWSVLTATGFGAVWAFRLALGVLLLVALALPANTRKWSMLVLSAALLASLGLVGHAAMEEGTVGWLHRLNHALHLLSAGFWIGCLPPLLGCLLQLRGSSRPGLVETLKRFSGSGHIAVALVLITGIVNTWLILGVGWPNLSSPYQLLLAIKVSLVATMVLIAVTNRYVIVPRLGDESRALRALAIGTIGEVALGAIVIGLVSAFATFDPV